MILKFNVFFTYIYAYHRYTNCFFFAKKSSRLHRRNFYATWMVQLYNALNNVITEWEFFFKHALQWTWIAIIMSL